MKEEENKPVQPSGILSGVTTEGKKQMEAAQVTPQKEENKEDGGTIEIPTKFKKIVEEIEKMSVLDLSELVKVFEKKFGVSASAVAAAGPAAAGPAAAEK